MKEHTLAKETRFSGKLIALETHEVQLEDGTRSYREIVRHPGAVALVVRCRDGRFAFVRQFRKAVERYMLEIVAGTLEPGEHEDDAARRELAEETGYHEADLSRLGTLYPSPGYVDERIAVYFADVGSEAGPKSPDEDEHLETVLLTDAEIEHMIGRNEIQDAKTLGAWAMTRAFLENRS